MIIPQVRQWQDCKSPVFKQKATAASARHFLCEFCQQELNWSHLTVLFILADGLIWLLLRESLTFSQDIFLIGFSPFLTLEFILFIYLFYFYPAYLVILDHSRRLTIGATIKLLKTLQIDKKWKSKNIKEKSSGIICWESLPIHQCFQLYLFLSHPDS